MSDSKRDFVEELIHEIQSHPALWDKRSRNFKDLSVKDNSWREILNNLRSTTEDGKILSSKLHSIDSLKKYWKNIRDTYTREKKVVMGKSGAGLDDVESEWAYFPLMQFLDQAEHYGEGTRGVSSNIRAAATDDQEGEGIEDGENSATANFDEDGRHPLSPPGLVELEEEDESGNFRHTSTAIETCSYSYRVL